MEQRLAKIANVIKDVTTADWKARVEALRELRSSLGDAPILTIRSMIPSLVKQIGDGRSLVMQEACETARAICFAFGAEPEFPPIADMLVRSCLPIVPSSTKVMSDAAKACLRQIVQSTTRGFQSPLERFLQGAQGGPGKATSLRLECVRLIDLCMNEWDANWIERSGLVGNLEIGVRKSLRDADSEVRTAARMTFTTFARIFPEEAKKSFRELEPEDKQRFQDLFPVTSSMANPSLIAASAAKRTPFHSNARATPMVGKSVSTRKPLQTISTNLATPSSTVINKRIKEETIAPVSFTLGSVSTRKPVQPTTMKKPPQTFRDRLVRSLVDLLGRSEGAEARARITAAMRDIAGIFYAHADELFASDFIQCESAVEMTVFNSDDEICKSGLDAMGLFIFSLGQSRNVSSREKEDIMERVASKTFPVALIKTQSSNDALGEAALRAVDACIEYISRNQLLAYALQYSKMEKDDAVMRYYAAVMDTPHDDSSSAHMDIVQTEDAVAIAERPAVV